jgi:hypothetical protein
MSHQSDDEKLEAYLRQFRARQPRALPHPYAIPRKISVPVLAAVAAVIMLAVVLILFRLHTPTNQQQIVRSKPVDLATETSLEAFSRLMRQDPEKLDEAMNSLSPHLLPDVQRSRGVLKTLARE